MHVLINACQCVKGACAISFSFIIIVLHFLSANRLWYLLGTPSEEIQRTFS